MIDGAYLGIEKMVKRIFDILVSALMLILFSPVLFLLASLVFFTMGRPILFHQARPGLNGKIFNIYKFRTMTNLKEVSEMHLPEKNRITFFGHFLRKTSLDELPELWNVLKGDMSLVGPRPLLVEYLPRYSAHQARRHEVRPGMTGWAQVNGRNMLSWEDRFNLDVWYVDNRSLWVDTKIIFLTVKSVFLCVGIDAPDNQIMPKFEKIDGESN